MIGGDAKVSVISCADIGDLCIGGNGGVFRNFTENGKGVCHGRKAPGHGRADVGVQGIAHRDVGKRLLAAILTGENQGIIRKVQENLRVSRALLIIFQQNLSILDLRYRAVYTDGGWSGVFRSSGRILRRNRSGGSIVRVFRGGERRCLRCLSVGRNHA